MRHRPLATRLGLLVSAAVLIAPPLAVRAADAPPAASLGQPTQVAANATPQGAVPSTVAPSNGPEQVVVTARHRTEKAQKVPIAITSVGRAELSNTGTYSPVQLQNLVPSLQITETNPRNTSFNIRGIGNNLSIANDGLESGVGMYVDGVFYSRPGQAVFAFPDIDNVQVLRGPQGTLFGKNTTAGAIDIRTLLPSFTFGSDSEATLGNYGFWQLKSTVTGPVNDKVAVRLSVLGDARNGTVNDPTFNRHYESEDDKAIRAQALILPADDLTIRLIADYAHQEESCCVPEINSIFKTYTDGKPLKPYSFPIIAAHLDYDIGQINPFQRNVIISYPTHVSMETGGVSAQADYELDGFTLTSISAWRFWNWDPFNDGDNTGLQISNAGNQTDFQRQATQEFRVTSPTGGPVDYTAGGFFFYQDMPGYLRFLYGQDAGPYYLNKPFTLIPLKLQQETLNDFGAYARTDPVTASYATYGQATWHVLPGLDLTGGLRYTYEDKSGSIDETVGGGLPISYFPKVLQPGVTKLRDSLTLQPNQPSYSNNLTHNSLVSYLTNASYQINENLMAYATYSRGSKSSGINISLLPAPNLLPANNVINPVVKPERVDNYELGFKSELFNNNLIFNAAAYWIQDNDYQGTVAAAETNGNVYTYISSVPEVESRGFEIDANTSRFYGVQLRFSGAYDDAIYESFPNAPCPVEFQVTPGHPTCNLSGAAVPGTSTWVGSMGGEYEHAAGTFENRDLNAYLGLDFSIRSSFYGSVNDSIYSKIPGYGILDLRAGVRTVDGKYDVFLWSHNATNTNYWQTLAGGGTGIQSGIVGDPETFGITVRVHL